MADTSKPNVIFILCDDLGYNDLGCYGGTVIPTPHLDDLAATGTRFTQCYTGAPICAPSRCVLNTGKHTGHCRVRDNFGRVGSVGEQKRVPLEPEDFTVAELLKQQGYATGMTGKWGLGEPESTGVPNRKGFDEWFGYLNQRNAHTYYPPYLWHNETKVLLEGNRDGAQRDYSHDMIVEFALDFIRSHAAGPFYLHIPWTLPHGSYEIPSVEPYEDMPWTDEEKVYAAMVGRIDRQVGEIVALLDELNIRDETLLFFGSDHGAARRWEGVFDSCGALRGRKGVVYEGGIRTPMICSWPGQIPAGVVSDQVWYYADFLPTVAEVTDAQTPDDLDGVSILPTLLGKEQDLTERFLYWEFYGRGFQQAARRGDWKGVRPPTDRVFDEPLELYDLSTDVSESSDVAAEHPAIVAEMEEFLSGCRVDSPNWPISS